MSVAFGGAAAPQGLFALAARVLRAASPAEKVKLTREAAAAWQQRPELGKYVEAPVTPARPSKPEIVPIHCMPKAKDVDVSTNIWVLHSLAHVELNAIDLSFDTLVRFAGSTGRPDEFAEDFLSIAVDEARHFEMLDSRLAALGSYYGALPAHDIVWSAADKSTRDCARRLALGQLVQEARGLDAGPKLAKRLVGTGDNDSAAVVNIIADEELRHVEIGVRWFVHMCGLEKKDAIKEFHAIALEHANPGALAPPFDEKRRSAAGLTPEWYLPVAEELREQMRSMREKKQKQKQKQKVSLNELGK